MQLKRLFSALLIAALLVIPAGPAVAQDGTIVDIAQSDADFSTLVTALIETGLAADLVAEGPFTVFAPTDDAFAALPEGLLDDLLGEPEGTLTDILLYHVLPGRVLAEDVTDGLEAETLLGEFVIFSVDGDSVMINHANIIAVDIEGSNGVIHVIDQVLLPPAVAEALAGTADATEEAIEEAESEEPAATATPVAEEEAEEEEAEETAEPAATPTPVATEEAEEEAEDVEVAEATATPVAEEEAEEATEEETDVEAAQDGPSVVAEDQDSDGLMVTVRSVRAAQSGWMVIHLDQEGRPGPVLGQTAIPTGDTDNVIVFLEDDIAGETTLWAMLHIDAGQAGVYEFPGPDVPARVGDDIVMTSFVVTAPEAEAPAATPTPVAEEEAEDVEMAEATATPVAEEEAEEAEVSEATPTPVAEEEADDDMDDSAPTQLPATGGGMTGAPLAVGAAMLVLLALAAGSILNRRRLA